MNSSSQTPALPTWIFIATDLALIGAATVIALLSPQPLSTSAIIWIVACVGVGAIIGLVPLVARYERLKNEALDERQRALEALARTISSSAEQISIAATGLNGIADVAHKNLRLADQLPHKLQEKIAEFQAQLAAAEDGEKEELERELLALRTSESERLDTISQRIAKSSAEWTRLEAATHQHLTAANEAVAQLASGTAGAIGKAQAAAEQALAQARVEAARALGEASGHAIRSLEAAKSSALAEIDARIAAASVTLLDRVLSDLDSRIPSPPRLAAQSSTDHAETAASPGDERDEHASRRPRKHRREDATANGSTPTQPEPAESVTLPAGIPESTAASAPEEPLPVPADTIPEITPVAPATAEPFSGHLATIPSASPVVPPASAAAEPVARTEAPKTPRKPTAKKPNTAEEPLPGFNLDDRAADPASGATERGLSSDGATRLLVTAYIGIGNRLYIRGDGPGLSWERGVPLQFVSIGKWRWETNDASGPVQFKLYKNDDVECAALGTQSLDPGHQHEITAAF